LWAHHPMPSRPVRFLQRLRLILSPGHHAAHHAAAFDRDYCITTGWLDPVLDAIGFFPALEGAVSRLTGAVPRRHDASAPSPALTSGSGLRTR
ncbi:MAG: fatty acid desaturase CarF family protein, partial [Candidatus Binatia bacterium]